MRVRAHVTIPTAIRPLPAHQFLRQIMHPFIGDTETQMGEQGISFLRSAAALAPIHHAFANHSLVTAAEQPIQLLVSQWQQARVARRVGKIRQHSHHPMSPKPLVVGTIFAFTGNLNLFYQ